MESKWKKSKRWRARGKIARDREMENKSEIAIA